MIDFNKLIERGKGKIDMLDSLISECDRKIPLITKKYDDVCLAQSFFQKVINDTVDKLRFQIEDIVNVALDSVFPDEYIFSVEFVPARGKVEANLNFKDKRTGKEVDPLNASGGGVVDLASFALRLACHSLESTDNVIVLDEPFKFLSKDLREKAGDMIKSLSQKLSLQIIMVTHLPEMVEVADKIFEVKKIDGISYVKEK